MQRHVLAGNLRPVEAVAAVQHRRILRITIDMSAVLELEEQTSVVNLLHTCAEGDCAYRGEVIVSQIETECIGGNGCGSLGELDVSNIRHPVVPCIGVAVLPCCSLRGRHSTVAVDGQFPVGA